MLTKIVAKLKNDGLLKTLVFLGKRLIRIQKHQVYIASYADVDEPNWLSGEQVYRSSLNKPWNQTLSRQIIDISPDNKDYLEAVSRGEAEGLAIVYDGQVVHYAFLMYQNKTACLLGFGKQVGLIGNAFTVNSYRGQGCQARSVAERINMAKRAGLDQVISETSYDNIPSQRGLAKSRLRFFGNIEIAVLLNTLVIRYRRPEPSIKRIGFCW